MITYTYVREDGTYVFLKHSIKDEPLKKCPYTGQKITRIIDGGMDVKFNGRGWAKDKYHK